MTPAIFPGRIDKRAQLSAEPTPYGDCLCCWRTTTYSSRRERAISSLAQHLITQGITDVAGPVLSGAIFAQMLGHYSRGKLRVWSLPKGGYAPVHHSAAYHPEGYWVWVDDIIASGAGFNESARLFVGKTPPVAAIVLQNQEPYQKKRVLIWDTVPILALNP